jgi:hypothetical protein
MAGVVVLILHRRAATDAGPLETWVADARYRIAEDRRRAFVSAGAADVRLVSGPPDNTPFGARLRAFVEEHGPDGLVVLGSGTIPLATTADLRAFVAAAASDEPRALTNNRFSADIVAVSGAAILKRLPDLPADNALPRWLDEVAGYRVTERRTWRLGVDVDGPLDLVLLGARGLTSAPPGVDLASVERALGGVAAVAADLRAELIIAGRSSAAALAWLERRRPVRVRALIEERGLRAAALAALGDPGTAPSLHRPAASVLGMVLDDDGPAALGARLARLGDGALVDSRVLLAHRLGADERSWPAPEDRFASDLLLSDLVRDPWLRELTSSAASASIPIVLGGHTLVGPGLRLALRRRKDRG